MSATAAQCYGTAGAGRSLAKGGAIAARLRTGRLLGTEEWIAVQEAATGRRLTPRKRGPKPKGKRAGNGG
jgi:hypothetical protein